MYDLRVENLTKIYANSKEKHVVLQNLSFNVDQGEFVSLLGPSGCGKTTLLNIIGGFLKPTSGRVIAGGVEVTKPGPDRAFIFQNYTLFPWMTVAENILYPMKLQKVGAQERQERLQNLLLLANLGGKEKYFPQQLSGGMKQRTGVVRALACRPRLLLMDEPLGAVDMQMRRSLQEDIENILMKDPATVILVTHDIDEAVFMSDRILLMSRDGLVSREITVGLPRPRKRNNSHYQRLVADITDMLDTRQSASADRLEAATVNAG